MKIQRIIFNVFVPSFICVMLTVASLAFAQSTEQITITSYYPSPFGAYDRLRLVPRTGAPPPCSAVGDLGLMYYDDQPPGTADILKICSNDGVSIGWQTVGSGGSGYWTENGAANALYPTTITRNVGIGIVNPDAKLVVAKDTDINKLRLEIDPGFYDPNYVGITSRNNSGTRDLHIDGDNIWLQYQGDETEVALGNLSLGGVTNPQAKLHVRGNLRLDSQDYDPLGFTSSYIHIGTGAGKPSFIEAIAAGDGTSGTLHIRSTSGNVGVGSTMSPLYNPPSGLEVTSDVSLATDRGGGLYPNVRFGIDSVPSTDIILQSPSPAHQWMLEANLASLGLRKLSGSNSGYYITLNGTTNRVTIGKPFYVPTTYVGSSPSITCNLLSGGSCIPATSTCAGGVIGNTYACGIDATRSGDNLILSTRCCH